MENRDCSLRDLREFFGIDDNKISEFIEHRINDGLLSRCNNFPSGKIILIEDYMRGQGPFFNSLKQLHEQILSKLDKSIQVSESVRNSTDTDIAIQLFSDQTDQEYFVESARRSLDRVYQEILNKKEIYDSAHFRGVLNLYYEILFDIQSCFGKCGRRTQQSADLDIFQLSKELMRHSFFWNMPVIPSAIFLIRQSIEIKIHQTFGIKEFLKPNRKKAIVGVNKIIDFCKKKAGEGIIDFPVDIELISKINTWCNHYVHTGNFSFPTWTVEWLQHSLTPLFLTGHDQNLVSADRSITIDEDYLNYSLFTELETYLSKGKKYKITVSHGEHKFLLK